MTRHNSTSGVSRFEPLSVLWRFLALPQTLIVLLGVLALVLIAGALVPQISLQAGGDPQAWFAVQTGFFGQQNRLFRTLGLFDLYHTLWFQLLLALVGLCLFVRFVESAELAWRATGRRHWTAASIALWGRGAPQVRLSFAHPVDAVHDSVRGFLAQQGYRWTNVASLSLPNAIASRRGLFLWARPVAYGALLVALVGLGIVANWGWQNEDWQPAPGDSQAVGHGRPLSVRLDAFHLQSTETGRIRDYSSQVTWLEGNAVVGQGKAGIGQPATLRGVTVRQVGYVPAVKIRAWDEDESLLALQPEGQEFSIPGEIELVFPTAEAQPLVFIPSKEQFLAFAFEPECVEGKPALHVALVRNSGTEQRPLHTLHESSVLRVDGLRLEVELTYRPILRVGYRPVMGLVVGGMALTVLALALGWLVPSRLAWIAVRPGEGNLTLVQILVPAGVRGRRWLLGLASQLGEELASDD